MELGGSALRDPAALQDRHQSPKGIVDGRTVRERGTAERWAAPPALWPLPACCGTATDAIGLLRGCGDCRVTARVQVEFTVPAEVRQEGACFVAGCQPLDVFSQGETEESALVNLAEALQLFIESCYERGTLEQVLKDCGFRPEGNSASFKESGRMVRVPLPLVAQAW